MLVLLLCICYSSGNFDVKVTFPMPPDRAKFPVLEQKTSSTTPWTQPLSTTTFTTAEAKEGRKSYSTENGSHVTVFPRVVNGRLTFRARSKPLEMHSEVPEVPEVPEVREVPEVPEVPEVREVPEVPQVPEGSKVPEVPEGPKVPDPAAKEGPPSCGTSCETSRETSSGRVIVFLAGVVMFVMICFLVSSTFYFKRQQVGGLRICK